MSQGKKYNLEQVLAEIEEDLAVQHNILEQQIDIRQSVIMNLMRKCNTRQDQDNNSRNN